MGFLSGVVTGIAIAAGAAAWYMSRSGESFRDQYQLEQRLGELGDRLERSTRDLQASVNAQLAEMRVGSETDGSAAAATERLDSDLASAAEDAAATAAEADAITKKARKADTPEV
jgi:hypothetical protein